MSDFTDEGPPTNVFARPANNERSRSVVEDSQSRLNQLLQQNKKWSAERKAEDPDYFERLCNISTPEFLWIGCADSRVPANVLAGLAPGEVFTQRNVGNQAMHTDLNCQACIEYAVSVVQVRTILVCGHYNCGAVAAALKMPQQTPGLVNHWISDIRVVYSLTDGLLKKLVGPISHETDLETHDPESFMIKVMAELLSTASSVTRRRVSTTGVVSDVERELEKERVAHVTNTVSLMNMLARHTSWNARGTERRSSQPIPKLLHHTSWSPRDRERGSSQTIPEETESPIYQ
eukprot:gene18703-25226_t